MPTLNIGKVRYTWKGTYSATTAYNILDRVKDADGYVYEAIKAAPAGTELTNENYWIKLSVQGPSGLKGDPGNDGPKGDTGEAPTAILYTEQNNLTDAQRAQARTNIGWAAAFAASFASAIAAWVSSSLGAAIEAYLVPILKQLCLDNGATQVEIDALENESDS
ncbi:hypothetical protein [Parasutterella excrementihominis]|uniref:hypothetical protein n=1 Tax=Parasutterella excrementihominis TaxID=487175 RepID=UPI0012BB4C37|nr:hypothetical protein [Parasutterella excrementihominis]MTT66052.1 hypothetical protein [Parasutterella excrementihominis]MTT94249.1 hypothetical protein [Parasutterella excrementihominis]